MANKKLGNDKANSFIIYKDYETYIETLTREQKGDIFSALFVYFRTGTIPQGLDKETMLLMKVFAVQMDRDLEKYEEKIEARRMAGKKSAEVKKARKAEECSDVYDEEIPDDFDLTASTDDDSVTDSNTNSTNVTFVEHNSTNSTYNSNNNNNKNNNININNNTNNNNNNNSNINNNSTEIDTEARLKEIYSRLYEI